MRKPHFLPSSCSRPLRYSALSALLAAGALGSIAVAQADAAPAPVAPASHSTTGFGAHKVSVHKSVSSSPVQGAKSEDCTDPDAEHAPYVTGLLPAPTSAEESALQDAQNPPLRDGQPLKDDAGTVATGFVVCPTG